MYQLFQMLLTYMNGISYNPEMMTLDQGWLDEDEVTAFLPIGLKKMQSHRHLINGMAF